MFLKKIHDRSARAIARQIINRANAARDRGDFHDAALLYEEALRLKPNDAAIHVQCANMLKDIARHTSAEEHYNAALSLRPDDADAWHQLGHLYKSWGRLDRAESAYGHASKLRPDWAEPKTELERLQRAGWLGEEQLISGGIESELVTATAAFAGVWLVLSSVLHDLPQRRRRRKR